MEFFLGGEKSPLIMEEFKALNAGAASERSGCQKQMDAAPAFDHSLRKPPQKTRKGGGGIRTPHLQPHAASHNFSCSPPPRSGINRTSQEAGAAACRCRMRSVLEEGALAPPRRRCCTSWKCLPIPFGCFLSFLPLHAPRLPLLAVPMLTHAVVSQGRAASSACGMQEKVNVPERSKMHMGGAFKASSA